MTLTEIIRTILRRDISSSQLAQAMNVDRGSIVKLRKHQHTIGNMDIKTGEKFAKYYRYLRGQRRIKHNVTGIATVADVIDKLHNPWHYYVYYPDGSNKLVQRVQPEVHKLGYQAFVIKTPFYQLKKNHIMYVLVKRRHCWFLVANPSNKVRSWLNQIAQELTAEQRKQIIKYVHQLQVEYQVGELNNRYCYIEIHRRSLQDAYYRLTMFELGYYNILRFCVNKKAE